MALQISPAEYVSDGGHVVITGPIQGSVTTADGTKYDVSGAVIEVPTAHAQEVADLIAERYVAEGHPAHDDDNPFVHTPAQPAAENTEV